MIREGEPLDDRGLVAAAVGDGRPLLGFTGLALLLSGLFAIFLALTGHFLPHDIAFLGMSAEALCALHDCRIVHFMLHDRMAFGGALVSIGTLYLWLAAFPLRDGEGWAWWAFCLSGAAGFASFLTYLGFSYLDSWHGVATVALFPLFVVGLLRSYHDVHPPSLAALLRQPAPAPSWRTRAGAGRLLLLLTALGLLGAGAFIMVGGMTRVFVPQDLAFMQLTPAELRAISPRLIPLIAHDRAGFGGALFSTGIAVAFCVRYGRPSRSLWDVLLLAGSAGFGFAIGTHFIVGYLNGVHLLPAFLGAALFALGLVLTFPAFYRTGRPG